MSAEAESEAMAAVYAARSPEELKAGYAAWAETYDEETAASGYRLPHLVAMLVALHVAVDAGAVLDAGCGTGLGGDLLHALGYRGIVGLDMSDPMMERAARLGAYAELVRGVLGETLPFPDGRFAAVMTAGVFTLGHAPASGLRELVRVTRPGGRLLFSVRDVVHDNQGFREEQAALEAEGHWRLVEALGPVRAFTVREPHVLVRLFAYERL